MCCSLAHSLVLNVVLFAVGLYFSFPNGSIGPAWPDILGGLGTTWKELSPVDEQFTLLPKKHVFLERSFSGFSVRLLAKMIPQCAQMYYCRPLGRRIVGSLLHFSQPCFWFETIMFC